MKEQLEQLGIPVLVERSSYESHPLGRMEWLKLYGVLLGKEELAKELFDEQLKQLGNLDAGKPLGRTVAFLRQLQRICKCKKIKATTWLKSLKWQAAAMFPTISWRMKMRCLR